MITIVNVDVDVDVDVDVEIIELGTVICVKGLYATISIRLPNLRLASSTR